MDKEIGKGDEGRWGRLVVGSLLFYGNICVRIWGANKLDDTSLTKHQYNSLQNQKCKLTRKKQISKQKNIVSGTCLLGTRLSLTASAWLALFSHYISKSCDIREDTPTFATKKKIGINLRSSRGRQHLFFLKRGFLQGRVEYKKYLWSDGRLQFYRENESDREYAMVWGRAFLENCLVCRCWRLFCSWLRSMPLLSLSLEVLDYLWV